MKKRLSAIVMALLLTLALCVPALAADGTMNYVIDGSDLLTYEEWEKLEDQAAAISQRHGCGVYIVIVDDYTVYGTGGVYDVTTQLYNDPENGFGEGEGQEGIILLLSLNERDYALFVHGEKAEYAFNSYGQAELENAFLPALGADDWSGGFAAYLIACDDYLTRADAGDPVRESSIGRVIPVVGGSCVIALVVCLVLKGKMKSVRRKAQARSYVAAGGLQLTERYDRFTHTTETVRTIENKSSSSQSGGGGSGRSGKF